MLMVNAALAAGGSDLTVRVLVYNYARVSNRVLGPAEREASRIFAAAGVDTRWVDCLGQARFGGAPSPPARAANADCDGPVKGAIPLRILLRSTPAHGAVPDALFGFANSSDLASVFYQRVEDLAWGADENGNEIPLILGDVMAHELGHLLLGTGSHAPSGIMRAVWDREFLQLALRGRQLFTAEQSRLLRAKVLRRQQETMLALDSGQDTGM